MFELPVDVDSSPGCDDHVRSWEVTEGVVVVHSGFGDLFGSVDIGPEPGCGEDIVRGSCSVLFSRQHSDDDVLIGEELDPFPHLLYGFLVVGRYPESLRSLVADRAELDEPLSRGGERFNMPHKFLHVRFPPLDTGALRRLYYNQLHSGRGEKMTSYTSIRLPRGLRDVMRLCSSALDLSTVSFLSHLDSEYGRDLPRYASPRYVRVLLSPGLYDRLRSASQASGCTPDVYVRRMLAERFEMQEEGDEDMDSARLYETVSIAGATSSLRDLRLSAARRNCTLSAHVRDLLRIAERLLNEGKINTSTTVSAVRSSR